MLLSNAFRRSVLFSLLAVPAVAATGAPLRIARLQQASGAEELPSARSIIDRYAEVTKRAGTIEKTSSMHQTGKFLMPAFGIEGSLEAWSAKPDKRMAVVDMGPAGKLSQGYDGKVAWMVHSMIGPRILKGPELLQTLLEADYQAELKSSPLIESIQTVGREKFEGKDCYDVQVVAKPLEGMDAEKSKEMRTSHEYYDVESGLLVGIKGRQEGEMGGGPYSAVVSDYKEFGGCLLPTKTVMKHSGQEFTLTTDSVEFDTATDDLFLLPKEIQAKLESEAKKAEAPKPEAPKPQ